jgi:hypothetical protein
MSYRTEGTKANAKETITVYRVHKASGTARIGSKVSATGQVAGFKVARASHERRMAINVQNGYGVYPMRPGDIIVKVEAIQINPEDWTDVTESFLGD